MLSLVLSCVVLVALGSSANAVSCGFRTTNLEGNITSPFQDSSNYASPFQCNWTIVLPPGYKIRLETIIFKIPEYLGNCNSDWVRIESLTSTNTAVSHGTYCGSTPVPELVSLGNELHIMYNYQRNVNRYWKESYFIFTYRAVFHESAYILTKQWIKHNTQRFFEETEIIPRSISSLFLFDETYFLQDNATVSNLITQFKLKLAADLIRNNTHPLSAADVSHHVTALLALCSNPRSVYGVDLVADLRRHVDKKKGLANPYYLLTLCNAGDKLTTTDIRKLKSIIESDKQDMFWLDFQAIALMTLVCVKEQNVTEEIRSSISSLKERQLEDGSFGSLQTTSLVVQALTAANAIEFGWNRRAAVKFVNNANNTDGSFGNLYNLYAAIPVISDKTLLDINSSRCDFTSEGLTPLEEIKNKLSEPIHVLYSVWIGDDVDYTYTVSIRVPTGTKFLDFMRLAATTDEKFQFQWKFVKDVPYVYEINGLVNDPSSGKYWTFFTGKDLIHLTQHTKGLQHYIPDDGDIAVMWYRTVSIEDSRQEVGSE